MARTGKGILDGFSGSIAQTTGSKDKGKSVIRAKPKKTPKTQTPALITSKSEFAKTQELTKIFLDPLYKQLWQNFNKKKTWFNNLHTLCRDFIEPGNFHQEHSMFGGKLSAFDKVDMSCSVSPFSVQWQAILEEGAFSNIIDSSYRGIKLFSGRVESTGVWLQNVSVRTDIYGNNFRQFGSVDFYDKIFFLFTVVDGQFKEVIKTQILYMEKPFVNITP